MSSEGAPETTPRSGGNLRRLLLTLAALAPAACLYALTICPAAYWGDGLELTAVAQCLGVSHPPGYPLYTLLGKIALSIPIGGAGARMNWISALSALAAAGMMIGLCGALATLFAPGANPNRPAAWAWKMAAALAFALSRFVWQHAVLSEVYAPMLAAHVGCLWLAVHTYRSLSNRAALALAFVYGVAWQCHYLSLILAPVMAAVALRLILARRACKKGCPLEAAAYPGWPGWGPGRLFCAALLCFCIGVSGYLALPIRARAKPPMNWGNVTSLDRLTTHLTGGHYTQTRILGNSATRDKLSSTERRVYLKEQSGRILRWPAAQFLSPESVQTSAGRAVGAALWLIALASLGILIWRATLLALGFAAALGVGATVLMVYMIQDIQTYFLGIWPLMIALVSGAFIAAPALASRLSKPLGSLAALSALPLGGAAILAAVVNFKQCDLSNYTGAEDYGRALMEALPENAILLASDDGTIFSAWYQQTVEGARPDVTVFGINFVFQGWYQSYFDSDDPGAPRFQTIENPPAFLPNYLAAVGGGAIIPNITRLPMCFALKDPKLEPIFIEYWHGELIRDLSATFEMPPITAASAAPRLYRMSDNPEYRAVQSQQYEDLYGQKE